MEFKSVINSIPKFSGDVSQLPYFCDRLQDIRSLWGANSETMILDEIPVLLVGRAYRICGQIAPKYKSLENFLKDLSSYFWDVREVHLARVAIKQMQQGPNESLREYGLRGSMLERKVIRLYEFALEISPDQVKISRETIKTEAVEYFLKG